MYYLGEIDATAVYWIIHDDQAILVNAPGQERLREFLSSRMESLGLPFREPDLVLLTSASPTETSGLSSLTSSPRVVAPFGKDAIAQLSGSIDVDRFSSGAPEFLTVAPLTTDSASWCAYSMVINSHDVLFTPAIPRNISPTTAITDRLAQSEYGQNSQWSVAAAIRSVA